MLHLNRSMTAAAGLLALGLTLASGPAAADEKEADSCLRTKIWDGYAEGWAVRTATSATLEQGAHRVFLVTLYAGNEYKLMVCGDNASNNIDLIIHDTEGNEVARDESADREPVILYKPSVTETYYVVMHAIGVVEGQEAGMAMAVTYR
jgi:hypothetical protein